MKRLLCGLVRGYQILVSPLFPRVCRFHPSCSEYMIQSITSFGVTRGVAKGIWRILRCNPLNPGGYDPVASRESEGGNGAEMPPPSFSSCRADGA